MRKCCKSDLLKEIERDFAIENQEGNEKSTLTVIDFMVVVRMICIETSKCKTFGELSDDALLKVDRESCYCAFLLRIKII